MEIDNTDNQESPAIFPPEIMDMVLRRLRPSELHSCRLVSTEWNDLCVRILKHTNPNNHHYYHLKILNIQPYVEFVRTTNANIFTPFRVSLCRNLIGDVILENLKSLKELAGPESIAAVDELDTLKDSVVFDILKSVCPGLESLDLSPRWFTPRNTALPLPRLTASITYPKLKNLICHGRGNVNQMVQFISKMMPNCPLLQDLELDCDLRNANKNKLTAAMEKVARALKGFSYSMKSRHNDLPFLFPKFPVLGQLKIPAQDNPERLGFWNTVALNFTPELIPALKSIEIPAGLRLDETGQGQGQVNVFPTVTSIVVQVAKPFCKGFHATADQIKSFLDNMLLAFPNVNRLGLDMSGSKEQHGSYIKRLIIQLLKSPIVASILELEMRNFAEKEYLGEALIQIETEYVMELKLKGSKFPTITPEMAKAGTLKLFAALGLDPRMYSCMDFTITKPIYSPDAHYILKAVDKDKGRYLKNVPTLRLRQNNDSGRYMNADSMEFKLIEKQFPTLEVLELSPCMLGSNGGHITDNIQTLRSKFKNWTVILLDDGNRGACANELENIFRLLRQKW